MARCIDMNLRYIYFLYCLLTVLSIWGMGTEYAYAQTSQLQVRVGHHNTYDRLVLQGNLPKVQINENTDEIQLSFDQAINIQSADLSQTPFIANLTMQGDRVITVKTVNKTNLRDLQIGNKLILDVYGSDKVIESKPEPKKEPPLPPEKEEFLSSSSGPESENPAPVEKSDKTPPPDIALQTPVSTPSKSEKPVADEENIKEVINKEDAKKPALLKQLEEEEAKQSHVLILSSTEAIRMGAYIRFGSLYIVSDRVDLLVPPRISGSNPELFGELKRTVINNGHAVMWELSLPEGYKVDVEGGALYWKFIFRAENHQRDASAIIPEPVLPTGDSPRQGKILLPMVGEKTLLSLKDPVTGEDIDIITVGTSDLYTDRVYNFIDFDLLHSPVGVAIVRHNKDLDIALSMPDATLSTPDGLAISRGADVSKVTAFNHAKNITPPTSDRSLLNFQEWSMGGVHALEENQQLLMASIRGKSDNGKAERLLLLAKLNLAHKRGVEALGYLRYASSIVPGLTRSADFIALRGVAHAMARQFDLAILDLFHPDLDKYEEIQLWRSYALAHLGDWNQAIETLPKSKYSILDTYPAVIADPLILTLGEIALRDGNIRQAENLLDRLEEKKEELDHITRNGLIYLDGEIARQQGNPDHAMELWGKLADDYTDDYHRTKGELARITLGLQTGKIKLDDAIERLERLRFVWRGDDLEIQVLKRLGLAEIENEKYLEGFYTLRNTVVLSPNQIISDQITALMISTYENIFLTDKLNEISPLDAAMLYEEFRELTPSGVQGDKLVSRLADRLVDADLFERAGKLLAHQIDYRLEGRDKFDTALRLAAIHLMDERPEEAIRTLNKVETLARQEDIGDKAKAQWDVDLLRARALSDMGDVSASLNILKNMKPRTIEVIRLEADVAWRAQRWKDAADALRDLVMTSAISQNEDLTDEQGKTLLNYAIALNLSNNRIELANLRKRYLEPIKGSAYGEMFEVITRPRQDAFLADRDRMMGVIGEIEIFQDFLDSYRASED
jgi:hypothetical protein